MVMGQSYLFILFHLLFLASHTSSFLISPPITNIRPNIIYKTTDTSSGKHYTNPLYHTRIATKLNVALSGKISASLTKLLLIKTKSRDIAKALRHHVNVLDILPIFLVGWIFRPLCKYAYLKLYRSSSKKYDDTVIHFITNIFSQIGKIASIVYLFDVLDIILSEIGFLFAKKYEFSTIVAKVCYTIWAAIQIKQYKYKLLQKQKVKNVRYPITIINRLLNLCIYIISSLILIDTLKLDMGVTLSSLFAFSGLGTIIISLASKNIATRLINGLEVSSKQKFNIGEKILLKDGTKGKVMKIGLLGIEILGDDELLAEISYSQIRKQRVINLSRASKSQVKQTLRFQYKDMYRLKDVLQEMKDEIKLMCPKLITSDKRSPLTIVMTDYKKDHVSVMVNTHHAVCPSGDEYKLTRQNVLIAIANVMERNDMQFALPSILNY